jgi:hypothetical protein
VRRYIPLFIILLSSSLRIAMAQTYSGKVTDAQTKSPLDAVSVVLLGEKQSPLAFTYSSVKGTFSIDVPKDKHPIELSFSIVGYARKVIPLSEFRNGSTVSLDQKVFQIKEVKVTSKRLQQSHDTLTYSVAGFRQKQDRMIADVIAKMPGMEVKPNGVITYQGKAINKFYIEGMDLMGSQYAQASENLSADKVENVQVLQNHQPVKALKDINFTEQAALNIVLKDDAKNTWNGVADASSGITLQGSSEWLRSCRLIEMMFGGRKQSISMYKCDNSGKDIQREVQDLTGMLKELKEEDNMLSQLYLAAPSINRSRYRFNDTHLFATNWLFKTPAKNDFRCQFNVLFDKSKQSQYRETIHSDVSDATLLTEETSARNNRSEWKGEIMYKINKNKVYLSNVLKGYADFNISRGLSLLNGKPTEQRITPRKQYIADEFEIIRTLHGSKSLSLSSQFCYNYLPGSLLLTDASTETLNLHSLQWNTYTYFRHQIGGMYVTYKAGFEMSQQNMLVNNTLTEAEEKYREYSLYVMPTVNFTKKGFKLEASAKLSQLYRSYKDQSQHPFVIEPKVRMRYELTSMISTDLAYMFSWNPTNINGLFQAPVYTDYITVLANSGNLDKTKNHLMVASVKYSNPLQGFFAYCNFNYLINKGTPLYEATLKEQIYYRKATGEYTDANNYQLTGKLSKAIGWAKLMVSLGGSLSWNNYKMLLSKTLTPYQMRSQSANFSLNLRPIPLLSFEENSTYTYSRQINKSNSILSSSPIRSFYHELKTYLLPGNWQIEWDNECYHSNDKSVSFNFFSDLSVSYRTKTFEIGIRCDNIFGNQQYERKDISTYSSIYTINRLRPRDVLAKVSINL